MCWKIWAEWGRSSSRQQSGCTPQRGPAVQWEVVNVRRHHECLSVRVKELARPQHSHPDLGVSRNGVRAVSGASEKPKH